MAVLNKVLIIGNLGKNPELRKTANGQDVGNFSVATTEKITSKDGTIKDVTEWHNIVVWGKTAVLAHQYLRKGSSCFLEGKLQTRKYQDKSGKDCWATEIIAHSIQFLDSKKKEGFSEPAPRVEEFPSEPSFDEIPF